MTTSISGTSGITFPNGSSQDVGAVGVGQTWQDLTSSRAFGTTYTNNTSRPIMVAVTAQTATVNQLFTFTINGFTFNYGRKTDTGGSNVYACITLIVPVGVTYSASGGTLSIWLELR